MGRKEHKEPWRDREAKKVGGYVHTSSDMCHVGCAMQAV